MSLCKCSVNVKINGHRDYHQTVEEAIADSDVRYQEGYAMPQIIRDGMIRTGNIIRIQAYALTPICFHLVYHYDLEAAIDETILQIKERAAMPGQEYIVPERS